MTQPGLSPANMASAWLNTMRGGGNGVDFTAPATLQAQLHVGQPGASGTANVSAGNSTKKTVELTASVAGSAIALTGTNPSWTNGGTMEELTHISVWSGATFRYSVALNTPQDWNSGNTFTMTTLAMALQPQAA